jgi:hypothetical protein
VGVSVPQLLWIPNNWTLSQTHIPTYKHHSQPSICLAAEHCSIPAALLPNIKRIPKFEVVSAADLDGQAFLSCRIGPDAAAIHLEHLCTGSAASVCMLSQVGAGPTVILQGGCKHGATHEVSIDPVPAWPKRLMRLPNRSVDNQASAACSKSESGLWGSTNSTPSANRTLYCATPLLFTHRFHLHGDQTICGSDKLCWLKAYMACASLCWYGSKDLH